MAFLKRSSLQGNFFAKQKIDAKNELKEKTNVYKERGYFIIAGYKEQKILGRNFRRKSAAEQPTLSGLRLENFLMFQRS